MRKKVGNISKTLKAQKSDHFISCLNSLFGEFKTQDEKQGSVGFILSFGWTKRIDLQGFLNCLNRSPTPKLGDLLPKVPGNWWLNSQLVGPDIDLKRDPLENEYFCFVGEKFTLS